MQNTIPTQIVSLLKIDPKMVFKMVLLPTEIEYLDCGRLGVFMVCHDCGRLRGAFVYGFITNVWYEFRMSSSCCFFVMLIHGLI